MPWDIDPLEKAGGARGPSEPGEGALGCLERAAGSWVGHPGAAVEVSWPARERGSAESCWRAPIGGGRSRGVEGVRGARSDQGRRRVWSRAGYRLQTFHIFLPISNNSQKKSFKKRKKKIFRKPADIHPCAAAQLGCLSPRFPSRPHSPTNRHLANTGFLRSAKQTPWVTRLSTSS